MTTNVPIPSAGDNPGVVLVGGAENAVAAARRFHAEGVDVVAVNRSGSPVFRSRGVASVELARSLEPADVASWLRDVPGLDDRRRVVLPLSDQALLGMIDAGAAIDERLVPAKFEPRVVAAMLDKQLTVELAKEAGVGVPGQWEPPASGPAGLPDDLPFPVILKPRRNFELIRRGGGKYRRCENAADLDAEWPLMCELESGFVVNEFIPGGDDQLSSYYALRDDDGTVRLEFTKRVDRRYPPFSGGATRHELRDLPETAAAGRRFFEHAGLVGLGNVEFKTHPETGELKIIECNHRLTAATPLMQDAGIDLVGAVFDQALGRPVVPMDAAMPTRTLWYPVRDLRSVRSLGQPLGAWAPRTLPVSMPYFSWRDPGPSLAVWRRTVNAWRSNRSG